MKNFKNITLSILFLTLSIFVLIGAYVLVKYLHLFEFNTSNKVNLTSFVKRDLIPNFLDTWTWDYDGIIGSKKDYPLVHLRSGFKLIKSDSTNVKIGWKYEVLNTVDKDFNVTVTYELQDEDDFMVGNSKSTTHLDAKGFKTIKGTIVISRDEVNRIRKGSGSISHEPNYKALKTIDPDERFKRASNILNENRPFWLTSYLEYGIENLYFDLWGKWKPTAEVLGIKKDDDLGSLRDKLKITIFNIPTWESIKEKSEYKALSDDNKSKIKRWLRLEMTYGNYDPKKGIKPIEYEDEFED